MIPSRNEGDLLSRTVQVMRESLPPTAEVIVVDDGSEPPVSGQELAPWNVRLIRASGLGPARSRNLGAFDARGDVLVFADAHVSPEVGWWPPFAELLQSDAVGAVAPVISVEGNPDSKGYGLRWRGASMDVEWLPPAGQQPACEVPLLPGCFLAMRREVFQACGGFDSGLHRWGSEDEEISVRLWLRGYELRLLRQVSVAHVFRRVHPYPVRWATLLYNRLRVAALHFNGERFGRVVNALRNHAGFEAAMARLADSDVWARRSGWKSLRQRPDDWFFQKFGLNF